MPSNGPVIHLVDDDESVRQSLAFLLATAGFAVRVHESGTALLESVDTLQPGCIISDIRMPGIDGLSLQRKLKTKNLCLPMIIMTGHADVQLAVQAMKDGAIDFIEKPFDEETIVSAVRLGLRQFEASKGQAADTTATRRKLETLSIRERQVLEGLLLGHPNKTIAYDLKISPRTVEVHRARVMTKMGASGLSELVRMVLSAERAEER